MRGRTYTEGAGGGNESTAGALPNGVTEPKSRGAEIALNRAVEKSMRGALLLRRLRVRECTCLRASFWLN